MIGGMKEGGGDGMRGGRGGLTVRWRGREEEGWEREVGIGRKVEW